MASAGEFDGITEFSELTELGMQIRGIDWMVVGRRSAVFGFELEAFRSEIEEEAVFNLRSSQIINELNGVGNSESFYCLEFNDQLILDDQICLKYADFFSLVKNW